MSPVIVLVVVNLHVPMLIVLTRRAPRTKSIFDRTSHRYAVVDSNCSHDRHPSSHNKDDIQFSFHLVDIIPVYNPQSIEINR